MMAGETYQQFGSWWQRQKDAGELELGTCQWVWARVVGGKGPQTFSQQKPRSGFWVMPGGVSGHLVWFEMGWDSLRGQAGGGSLSSDRQVERGGMRSHQGPEGGDLREYVWGSQKYGNIQILFHLGANNGLDGQKGVLEPGTAHRQGLCSFLKNWLELTNCYVHHKNKFRRLAFL